MTQRLIRKRGAGPVGAAPTVQQKILHANKKLGLDLSGQQGSALNIFDTVLLTTNATQRQTLSFFTDTQRKSANFTNLQGGTLTAGESLGIAYIYLAILTLSGTDLTNNATGITAINPITANVPLVMGTISVGVGNSTLIDNYMLIESHPAYNPDALGVTNFNATASDSLIGVSRIRLDANPVIPPNLKFSVTVSFGPLTAVANTALMVCIGRSGSIFSAKTTL